mmetsp:Transcript_13007/g.23480  ORF Transcript_13007/g.23480 Transcript_13007/m.23480 type:complete len:237 (-) Transcript_13007:864-1574(-)
MRCKRWNTSDLPSQNQCMNVVCSFVSIHGLQVVHMPHDVILVRYSIPSQHITRHPSNIQRLSTTVALNETNHTRRSLLFFHEASHLETRQPRQRDFRVHIGQLLLNQLIGTKWCSKLLPLHYVFTSTMETIFRGSQCPPGDAKAGIIQAAERSLQTCHVQFVRCRNTDILHENHAGDTGTKTLLSFDFGCIEARSSLFNEIALYLSVFVACPDDEYICYWAVRDPILRAIEYIFVG